MSVALVGPGAIGAAVAAALHAAGTRVRLHGRTAHARMTVRREGEEIVLPGPVGTDPAAVTEPVEHVLLGVKDTQLAAAAAWLERLCDAGTTVCVLQNGIEQRERVGPLAPAARIVPAVVWFSAATTAPGEVRVNTPPWLTLPDDPGGRALAALLKPTWCGVTLRTDFATAAWEKLVQNAVAGLLVLVDRRTGAFRGEGLAELARAYGEECVAVAQADGAPLAPDTATQILARFQSFPADLPTSIQTDRAAGRPLEWEVRNDVIRRRGREHGVPTPISDVVVPLLAAASA